jgi:hypothetical protein
MRAGTVAPDLETNRLKPSFMNKANDYMKELTGLWLAWKTICQGAINSCQRAGDFESDFSEKGLV